MTVQLTPTFDRVLIQPFDGVVSKSIVIPDSVKERRKSQMGQIVAVGPDASVFRAGQKVSFSWYEAEEIEHEGVKYALVRKERVLALLGS